MKNLTVSALNNSATDKGILVDVIAKCFNNYEDVDKVADEALPMFCNMREYTVLQEAFDKITEHSLEDLFMALSEKIDTATDMDTLVNLAVYSSKRASQQAATLYLKTLTLSLERDNVPDKIVRIVSTLSEIEQRIRIASKDEFIASLHSGYIRTTSESILNSIVIAVRQNRWTKQFKRLLKDNTDKLDIFDKLAK